MLPSLLAAAGQRFQRRGRTVGKNVRGSPCLACLVLVWFCQCQENLKKTVRRGGCPNDGVRRLGQARSESRHPYHRANYSPHVILGRTQRSPSTPSRRGECLRESTWLLPTTCSQKQRREYDVIHVSWNQMIPSELAKWVLDCQSVVLCYQVWCSQPDWAGKEWTYRRGYCPSKLCRARGAGN